MFSPMSSGRDSWQNEPGSIKAGRFRAHQSSNPNQNQSLSSSNPNSVSIPISSASSSNAHKAGKAANRNAAFQSAAPSSRQQPFYSNLFSSSSSSSSSPHPNNLQSSNQILKKPIHSLDRERNNFNSDFTPSFAPAAARRKERLRNRVDSNANRPYSSSASGFRRNGNGKKRSWTLNFFRPTREVVEILLESWWKRWFVLAVAPSLLVWFWCAVPFPKSDPYSNSPPWCGPPLDNSTPSAPWCEIPAINASASASHSFLNGSSTLFPSPTSTAPSQIWNLAQSSNQTTIISLPLAFLNQLKIVLYHLPLAVELGSTSVLGTSSHSTATATATATVDANFWFFLIFYYGIYCAVALVYITQLFSLYRLNWWPAALGAKTSYLTFWILSLCTGYAIHVLDPLGSETGRKKMDNSGSLGDGVGNGEEDDIQWQRKTLWVGLAFATMAMPALVCLAGLRRSGRQNYRHSLTEAQKTFLERQLARRIPASYIRFLWFISTIGMALFALIAGQGYASVYLSTLPHTGLDGTAYVTFWMTTVNVLSLATHWILEEKVKSRALLFVFKYYYFLVYFIFYRNLFARLQSLDQFAFVQLLSSFWVVIWYPFSMSSFCWKLTQLFNPDPKSWEEYVESVGLAFYLRNLAQNTTMLAFLGWVSILHFGPNQHLYPFFAFDDKRDPYNYQLTMFGSLAIWGSELFSSYIARELCKFAFQVDVTNLGLDEMREYPEIVPTCVWTSIHVLMDMLLFLIKLNFQ